MTENATSPKLKYINLWVRSVRASIEGDQVLRRHLGKEASQLEVSETFRDWLPMLD